MRRQLYRWEDRAAEIADPMLRGLALGKLRDERFNTEAAAMIATTAPTSHRAQTVEAIVALQVMYDYLDALTEQPTADPIRDGLQYSQALADAVAISTQPTGEYYAYYPGPGDAGYLVDLAAAVRGALLRLPAIGAIADVISICVSRFAEAQVRMHAVAHSGTAQLEHWATCQAKDSELHWREWLCGSMASVVAAHALIAAAAVEHTTREQAGEIDSTYLSVCVVITALDHLVDHERDAITGAESYLKFYETPGILADQIVAVARRVMERTRTIPDGPHHAMILAGVVAFYTSQPSAMREFARPVTEKVRDQLGPLIMPTLATMHMWRLAKRGRLRWQRVRYTKVRPATGGRIGADRGR